MFLQIVGVHRVLPVLDQGDAIFAQEVIIMKDAVMVLVYVELVVVQVLCRGKHGHE